MTAFPVRLKATCLAFLFGASAAIAAETGMVAPSGDASGVVRVGLVDTFTPSFYIDVYTPLIESLKARLPQYRFETKEISHADAMKPESVENIDFVIVSSGGARMLSRAGLQQIATLRKSRCADVSRSVGAVFLVPAGSRSKTCGAAGWPRRHLGLLRGGSFLKERSPDVGSIPRTSFVK